uniref:G_PROTEIN_RECEP_F1_2 domain-containing protein n=1 Tax=Magallana gigas TaxID=29159 RepID=A0A8W8M555_MAGGI
MEGNNSTKAGPSEMFIPMPVWQQILFITMYVVMIVVAAGGNLAVIWIVMAHKRMRTFTNYFLVNLAVADTLISLFNTAFVSTFLIYQDWWYGEIYCKFSNFINVSTLAASVLTFMSITRRGGELVLNIYEYSVLSKRFFHCFLCTRSMNNSAFKFLFNGILA